MDSRLNLFQANQITEQDHRGLCLRGSRIRRRRPIHDPGALTLFPPHHTTSGVTGQIGNLRIGGASPPTSPLSSPRARSLRSRRRGQLDAKISNFYIGGQTNNVLLVAPSGSRNISFGLGMDNVTINSDAISSLRANRDASNSQVTVSRSIGNLLVGGDVTNTNVNVGESQSLFTFTNVHHP